MRSLSIGVCRALVVSSIVCLGVAPPSAQELDESAVLRRIDAAAEFRYENVLGFTDIEHYAVFRGKDETHPAAEMTVKTTYRKGVGKSYGILSKSGSDIIQKFGLQPLLDNEQIINLPGNTQRSWFTTANYEMKLKPGGPQPMDGRGCLAISMKPRQKAPNMIDGTLWVDAKDDSIVRIEGIASRNPSVFSGTTQMMRKYENLYGFAMATRARAEANSFLFGRTVVTIDYSGYQFQLLPPK